MKPPPFRYEAARTVEEALACLAEHGMEAKPLAGGQSLVPLLNFRLARPAVLVDLNGVDELAYLRTDEDGALRIGAMARQADVERSAAVRAGWPLLTEALGHVAHPAIRNRGTVGGSVAHADPAAELPAVLLALEARFHLRGPGGRRRVEAGEFFLAPFATVLEPDELLTEIEVPPAPSGVGWAFEEVARRHGDYALAGAAAVVALDEEGRCRRVRLAFVNAGLVPVLAAGLAERLEGTAPRPDALREAANAVAAALDPPEDVHATAPYRRHLAAVLAHRALARAVRRTRDAVADPLEAAEPS